MADKKQIEWEIRLRDLASKILKELGTNAKKEAKKADSAFSKLGKSLGGMVGAFGKIAAGVGVAAVAFKAFNAVTSRLSKGVEDAIAFSRAMAEVSTISEDVAARLGSVTDQVLDLSTKFGLLETDAAKALYQTISAGVTDTTQAMDLLDGAVTLSRGGLADLTSTIDLLTNSINAYGMSVDDVEHINNVFFETVRLGKTTITNLADSMGVAMPIAASLGVSIEELSAMLAALTKGGVDTTTAVIYVRQALNSILKPSTDAQKLMTKHKISFDAATVASEGFIGILNELKLKLGDNIESWQKFFPNVRAFIPVLALAGNQFEEFQTILGRLTSAALDEAQPAMRALERVMLSAGEKVTVLRNAVRQGFMEIGMGIIEGVTGPISSIEELQGASLSIREAIAGLTPVVQLLAGTMLQFVSFIPAMIALFTSLAEEMGATFSDEQRANMRAAEEGMKDISEMAFELGRAMKNGGQGVTQVLADIAKRQSEARQSIVKDVAAISGEYQSLRDILETRIEYGVMGRGMGDIGKTFGEILRSVKVPGGDLAELSKAVLGEDMLQAAFRDEVRRIGPGLRDLLQTELYAEALDVDMAALQPVIDQLPGRLLPGIGVAFDLAARKGEGNLAGAMEHLTDEALVALLAGMSDIEKGYKDAVADFQVKTGRSFAGVRDEVIATMSPEQFAGAVAQSVEAMSAEVGPGFSILGKVVEDASKGVYPTAEKGLREAFAQLGDDGLGLIKKTYLQLQAELDQATESAVLGPDALRVIRSNVHKAQQELLKLGGPELRQQLEDDINRALGAGVDTTEASRAAAERAARIDEANFLIREQTLLLEKLKLQGRDTVNAQIKAIRAQTEVSRQELAKRLEGVDEETRITKEEYDQLYAALEEGEKRQIKLVRETAKAAIEAAEERTQKEREELEKREKAERDARIKAWREAKEYARAMERLGERLRDQYISVMTQAAEFVTGMFIENFDQIGGALGAALTSAVGGALGELESFVTMTPEMELASMQETLAAAEQQLEGLKALNLASIVAGEGPIFTEEQLASLQAGIDNVREYALAAAEAEVQQQKMKERFEELPEGIQGAAVALAEFIQTNLDMKAVMQDFMRGFLDQFSSMLTQTFVDISTGAKDASDAWSDFGEQFLLMVNRMATQLAVMITLAMLLNAIAPGLAEFVFGAERIGSISGKANGGVVEGGLGETQALADGGVVLGGLGRAMPVKGYANGGPIVNQPHVALIGEGRYNEAVVPLPDGRSIPVEMRGQSEEPSSNINIAINAVDAKGIDALLNERKSTVKDLIRQALVEDRLFRRQVASAK